MSEEKKYRKVVSIFADFNKNIVSMEKTDNLDKDGENFSSSYWLYIDKKEK